MTIEPWAVVSLVAVLSFFGFLAWAELQSRRLRKKGAAGAAGGRTVPPNKP